MSSKKKDVSSRRSKFEPDKKGGSTNMENKSVMCGKCETEMEFFGVNGNGGLKFSCPRCYEKQVARNT